MPCGLLCHGNENCQTRGHLSTPVNSCEVYEPQRGPWKGLYLVQGKVT